MNPAVIDIDERTGELVTGYFYLLEPTYFTDGLEIELDGHVIGKGSDSENEQGVLANYTGSTSTKVFNCDISTRHLTWEWVDSMTVEAVSGQRKLDFIRHDGPYLIVDRSLRQAMEASALRGAHFCPVTILQKNRIQISDIELFGLRSQPNAMCRVTRVYPEEANRCFKCGFSPICCPTCGHVEYDCPRCQEEVTAYDDEHGGANDPRIKIIAIGTGFMPIIEVGKWDGRDVLGDRFGLLIVTKRVVEFLLARHSTIFRATPLRANIAGISEEKRQLLESATRLPN